MEYYNFAIEIGDQVDGHYPLKAHSDTMGEADGVLALGLDSAELVSAQQRLGPGTLPAELLTGFGELLWNGLFAGEVRDLYSESVGRVHRDEEKGVRIRLCIATPGLSALPWELTYDRHRDTFLATSSETPLTRYINLHEPIDELTTSPPVKVLVAIPDGSGLDVAMERAIITDALSELGDAVKVAVLEGDVTRSAISQALLQERYNVLHFIGHGRFQQDDGYLVLNTEEGGGHEDLIPGRSFAGFFRDYPSMKLVVLNSCQGAAVATTRPLTGVAPQLVRAGIPSVVAMQYPVADAAAVLFAREFYLNLCTGANRGRIDSAISHARNRLQMDFGDTLAFATPVLYMRSPSGVIFDLESAAARRMGREDVHRLKAVQQARENNVAALQATGSIEAATKIGALQKEGEHIAAIKQRLRSYYLGIAAVVAASWLVLFASWVGLFNVFMLDDRLERQFVGYMDAFVQTPFDDRIVLIEASASPGENGSLGAPTSAWRCHHAKLLDGLAAAKASVVAFDLYFEDPSACDQEFARAIRQATASGTPVVLGARRYHLEDGFPAPVMVSALSDAVHERWGILEGKPVARRVTIAVPIAQHLPAAIEEQEGALVPSFALQTVMQAEAQRRSLAAPLAASIDRRTERIRLRDAARTTFRSIPTSDPGLNMIVGVADRQDLAPSPYYEVLPGAEAPDGMKRFRGKIVIIGYATPDDRWALSPITSRYGVELQASAISNLLQEVNIRAARPVVQYLLIVVMGAIGAVIRIRLAGAKRFSIPLRVPAWVPLRIDVPLLLVGVVLAYFLAAFVAYKAYNVILDINYHVASLLLVYWMIGWVRKGIPVTRIPKEA